MGEGEENGEGKKVTDLFPPSCMRGNDASPVFEDFFQKSFPGFMGEKLKVLHAGATFDFFFSLFRLFAPPSAFPLH